MSNAHLSIVRDIKGVKGPARAVLMVLADRASDSGECWPSIATLTKECGFSRSTVKNSLKLLRDEKGLISWTHRTDSAGDLTSSLYTLTLGGRAGADPPRAGADPQVGQELTEGRAGADHKASFEAKDGSVNEASLFDDEFHAPAESIPPKKKHQQELAESIYREYPKKTAKDDALKAILKAMKENDPAFLLERTKAYASAIGWKEKQFIPYPATWFNKGHFNDDPETWKQPSNQAPKQTAKPEMGGRTSTNSEEL